MQTKRNRKIQRLSRKGRVPFTFEISSELKAKVLKIAKKKGVSISEAAAEMLEDFAIRQAILEQMTPYIEEKVKEKMEQTYSEKIALLLEATAQNKKMYRVLKRILTNPAESIAAIEKEIEELDVN